MEHLAPEIISYLDKPDADRVEFVRRSMFIWYAQAEDILYEFNDLITVPKSIRMPNYLLVGEPNSGKSSILQEFQAQHTVRNIPGVGPQLDVFTFQAPIKADESRLYSAILEGLNIAHNDSDIASNKLKQVKGIIKSLDIKVLVIDELHNIAPASPNAQRSFLTTLKYLANELEICMICAGTPQVRDVVTYDRQLTSRFETVELESWKTKPKEFIAFLKGYERRIPLKLPSNLAQLELATLIFKLGEGLMGEYCTIIKKAAVEAIRSKSEKITIETIEKLKFIPPSKRGV